jgi:hypothetical protein
MKHLAILMSSLFLISCGGGGGSSTTTQVVLSSAKIVSLSSASSTSMSVQWIESQGNNVSYDVHISTQENFTISAQNLATTTTNNYAELTNLTANTVYYAKVVAKDTSGSTTTSNQLSAQTVSITPVLKSNIQTQKSSATISNNSVESASLKSDDIIYNEDSESPYLKKVVSTSTDANGKTTATTENATLLDVYKDLEFSTSTRIEDLDTNNQTSNSSNANSNASFSSAFINPSEIKLSKKWQNGLIMEQSYSANKVVNANAVQSQSVNSLRAIALNGEDTSDKDSYFQGELNDYITVGLGDSLSQKIKITSLNKTWSHDFDGNFSNQSDSEKAPNSAFCKAQGGIYDEADNQCNSVPIKICSIDEDIFDVDVPENAKSKNNKPRLEISGNDVYVKWTPQKDNIDFVYGKPYSLDIKLNLNTGVFCGTSHQKLTTFKDDINFKNIKIGISQSPAQSGIIKQFITEFSTKTGNVEYSLVNNFNLSFTPDVKFDLKVENATIKKGKAGLSSNFTLNNALKVKVSGSGKHTFKPKGIYTKKFTKVVMAGYVPIVIVGRLRLMAVAEVDASGSIEASINLNDIALDMGIEANYNTSTKNWDITPNKSLTYEIKAGAKGTAELTGTIRIIPSLELSLYEAAAAHFVLEPYLYSTVGVDGEINASMSNNAVSVDAAVQFNKLEAGVGMDAKFYAGPAWDATDTPVANKLIYPSGATYAPDVLPIKDASFTNSNHAEKIKKYYEYTDTYKKITVVSKKRVVAIPELDYTIDKTKVPPSGINSRAIKFIPTCEKVKNETGIGKEYFITCASWKQENITTNFKLDKSGSDYWITPNATGSNYTDNTFRFVNNSSLKFARQYIRVNIDGIGNTSTLPGYFKTRYGLTSNTEDKDGDGFDNLAEFNAGSSPTDTSETPKIDSINAPQNLTLTPSDKSVKLDWEAVEYAKNYVVYYGTSANTFKAKQLLVSTNTATINNLTNDTKYYFAIVATRDNLTSDDSQVKTATPTDGKTPITGSFSYVDTALNQGETKTIAADLSNLDNGTGSVYFYPTRDITGININSQTAKITILGNAPTGINNYEVKASSTDGGTITTSVKITVNVVNSQTPTITITTPKNGEVYLAWSGITGATYNLYYAKESFANLGSISNYATLNGGTLLNNLSVNDKTITGLTNNTKYYFVLTSVKNNVESGKSNEVSATPVAPTPPNTATSTLNDTGITWGGDYPSGNNATCTGENISAQDCSHGRDKTHNDDSDGHAGFSFTKLSSSGAELPASATNWSCVKDNITGLIWEVKTDDGGIHDKDNTYRWGGKTAIGRDHSNKEGTYYDDWNTLVDGSNNENLCGFNNWRVPTKEELRSIVNYGVSSPAIDVGYFINNPIATFWSSSGYSYGHNSAWLLSFYYGEYYNYSRGYSHRVRLVVKESADSGGGSGNSNGNSGDGNTF